MVWIFRGERKPIAKFPQFAFGDSSVVLSKAKHSDYFEVFATTSALTTNETLGKCVRKERVHPPQICWWHFNSTEMGILAFCLCSRSVPLLILDRAFRVPRTTGTGGDFGEASFAHKHQLRDWAPALCPVLSIESATAWPDLHWSGIIYFSISSWASRRISWLFICRTNRTQNAKQRTIRSNWLTCVNIVRCSTVPGYCSVDEWWKVGW